MTDFWLRLFDPTGFVPRRLCGDWSEGLVLLHTVSDTLIWLAYLAIPCVLVYFVRRRRDIPFSWMFLMFCLFIVFCGFTHFLEVVMFYDPLYRLAGLVKLVTAVASWAAVFGLIPLVPKALALRGPAELQREIAERRRVEAELRKAEARYRMLVEQIPAVTFVASLDDARSELYVSPQIEALLGFTQKEWQEGPVLWYAQLHPDDRDRCQNALAETLAFGVPFRSEVRFLARNRRVVWVQGSAQLLRDDDGRPTVMQGIGFDITERKNAGDALQRINADLESLVQKRTQELIQANKALEQEIEVRRRAEERLRTNEERLRLALSAAHMGTWHWDLTEERLDWSPECKALFGLAPDEPVDYTRFLAALYPADRERTDKAARQCLEEKSDYNVEYRVARSDGVRWLSARGRGSYDAAGRAVRMEGVVLDVTERKRMEQQLEQRAADLAEADRNKDEFLAMLAHELRNPLAPVRNALQIMRLSDLTEPRLRWSRDVMDRQVDHMVRLVDDLLDVARIRGGLIALRKEAVDLQAVVDRAVETARPGIEARRHDLTVRMPPEPVRLHADPTRLAQVFSNLLHNAAKYTPEGGRIEFTAKRGGDDVIVRVKDNGRGIRPALLTKVFDLFTQGDRSLARTEGGLGIGLTLVRSLVESHGGSVRAFSAGEGLGSEFVVRLPVRDGSTPAAVAPAPGQREVAPSHRILVVDDNSDGAESLALLLRSVGHQVRTANDGAEALQIARAFRPHIVFLDIGLPRMDGYEVARRLRQEPGMETGLLVALTGYGHEEDRRKAMEAGFDVHLVKPADLDTLQDIVAGA